MIVVNPCAYPVLCETKTGDVWRLWRPDQEPHISGLYANKVRAWNAADKLNKAHGWQVPGVWVKQRELGS